MRLKLDNEYNRDLVYFNILTLTIITLTKGLISSLNIC